MARTNIYYTTVGQEQPTNSPQALIKQIKNDIANQRYAICVIENISSLYTEPLIANQIFSSQFVQDHEAHEARTKFWTVHHPWRWSSDLSIDQFASSRAAHIDGMFEYHGLNCNTSYLQSSPNYVKRDCFEERPWPIQSNTRISYYRSAPSLCGSNTKFKGSSLSWVQMSSL